MKRFPSASRRATDPAEPIGPSTSNTASITARTRNGSEGRAARMAARGADRIETDLRSQLMRSRLLCAYDQTPPHGTDAGLVLMMVLRWERLPRVGGDFIAACLTLIDPGSRRRSPRIVKVIKNGVLRRP